MFVSSVDDPDRNPTLSQQVDQILRELSAVTRAAIGREVSDEAAAWWTSHYRAKFYYAIHCKARSYERDAAALKRQAQRLGEMALAMAGPRTVITREHAALASFVLDCPPDSGISESTGEWCN